MQLDSLSTKRVRIGLSKSVKINATYQTSLFEHRASSTTNFPSKNERVFTKQIDARSNTMLERASIFRASSEFSSTNFLSEHRAARCSIRPNLANPLPLNCPWGFMNDPLHILIIEVAKVQKSFEKNQLPTKCFVKFWKVSLRIKSNNEPFH